MDRYDVIVVGSGIAGLYCCLELSDSLKVLLLTKDSLENSNSSLAQGGIAVLRYKEDFNLYFEDTMKAGRYENNLEAVKVMINESQNIIKKLINYGVQFEKENDELKYTKEGAHSIRRILHYKDVTGKEIVEKLILKIKSKKNLYIREYCEMVDIIKNKSKEKNCEQCIGIVVNFNNEKNMIYSNNVVLATGGIGGLFLNSTNKTHIKGDGIAIAIKNNINIKNINYIQIHPTALYTKKSGRRFLISEAVRGEGGWLLNPKGERFVNELLPRDVVSEKIAEEMKKFNSSCVYLSIVHLGSKEIKNRFPNIYKACLEEGYDITKTVVPVTPAQHYFMGGIEVDLNGQTSMNNLYAIGETSCTGVHGANRLASNSLLEAAVFAKRVANLLNNKKINNTELNIKNIENKEYKDSLTINNNLIINEIKRKDEKFYDKWLKHGKY
ncbi:L-aspartate oxidase [Clostridium tarantellae]|uniref:L-aspartate oxidase n=1 Tax=Clostridium tarantellae TaxID=39493 RepID=A0A6I1MK86_9CLOT|nr:L-aspartate oxidase [Clostridium tarantellae]MPQ42592.1 L-aspartate oxidase [Clostridium tarantellae]